VRLTKKAFKLPRCFPEGRPHYWCDFRFLPSWNFIRTSAATETADEEFFPCDDPCNGN